MPNRPRIGVLALQGDFEAHEKALAMAGAQAVQIRTAGTLHRVDGLIIPGGESTTMLKLLRNEHLFEAVREFGSEKPIFGTCAGAILLATEVTGPAQESLGLMDIGIERNAYGRQLDSRIVHLQPEPGSPLAEEDVEAVFIRAPIIRRVGDGAAVLARYNGDPVLVSEGRHLAATFHPELSGDDRIHRLFVERVQRG
jgi:5'-phosphate synthase pdxT subunit